MNRACYLSAGIGALWLCVAGTELGAQTGTSGERVPRCAKEFCQEMVIYATAFDSLLSLSECRSRPVAIVRNLYSAPFSYRDTRRGSSLLDPRSPVLGRIDDGPNPFRQFGPRVRIVDVQEFDASSLTRECVFIFSPVAWMGESMVRIIVLEVQPPGTVFYERYIYLRRVGGRWTISLLEAGMVS